MSASPALKFLVLAGLVLLLAAPRALAQTQPPAAGNDTVQGYAKTAPNCLAWSDGCVICARDEKGAPHCSTPGIACIPVAVACKVSRSQ